MQQPDAVALAATEDRLQLLPADPLDPTRLADNVGDGVEPFEPCRVSCHRDLLGLRRAAPKPVRRAGIGTAGRAAFVYGDDPHTSEGVEWRVFDAEHNFSDQRH